MENVNVTNEFEVVDSAVDFETALAKVDSEQVMALSVNEQNLQMVSDINASQRNELYAKIDAVKTLMESDEFDEKAIDAEVKSLKAMSKALGGLKKKTDDLRKGMNRKVKDAQKVYEEPLKAEVTADEEAQASAAEIYEKVDTKKLMLKTNKLEAFKVKALNNSNLRPEYMERVSTPNVSLSSTLKSGQEDIMMQINNLQAEQAFEDQARTSILALMEAYNTKITQKITDAEPWVQKAMDLYRSGMPTEEVINKNNTDLIAEFERIQATEEAIRQQAIEAERQRAAEAERLAQAKAAEEAARIAQEVAMNQAPVEEATQAVEQADTEIPNIPAWNAWSQTQTSKPIYHFQISLEGDFDDIKACGDEILAICKAHNVKFNGECGGYLATVNKEVA